MLRPILIFFLFASVLLSGCATDEDAAPRAGGLQDSWTWVQSSSGSNGARYTPASSGKQQQVEFDQDGNVRYYENGRLVKTDTYTIERGSSIRSPEPTLFIRLSNGQKASFEVHNNSLFLWDEVHDGYQHEYQR